MGKSNTKKWALGAIIAGIAGYLAGILTAPKSGKETRQDIKDTAQKAISEAEKELKKLHTQMTDLLGQAKQKVDTLKGNAQKELQTAMDKTAVAKEKARELLSAVHEGNDADDKDLRKAINEANQAIEHLKVYMKK
jgi:gas vesicle protein